MESAVMVVVATVAVAVAIANANADAAAALGSPAGSIRFSTSGGIRGVT